MNATREVYTLADLSDWSRATAGMQPALRLAVMGDPIAHSASPPMQNAALAEAGIDLGYTRLHIRPNERAEAMRLLAPAGFLGINVTLPHKTAILPLLDSLDPHAALLGAVNTVRVEQDGSLRGFNTDGPGFSRAVAAEFGMSLRGARVLILGAGGGAGRALAAQCASEGCARLALVNRTAGKVETLAEELRDRFGVGTRTMPWDSPFLESELNGVDLIVNTSSLGLQADDPSPLPTDALPPGVRVFDTVYRRGGTPTPLVAAARAVGLPVTGGLALLLHQGALAFEHWFGRPAPLETMRRALQAA